MEKIVFFISITLFTIHAFSQDSNNIPQVDLKTLDGQVFNTKNIDNGDNPIILSFWATWCKPCIKELTAYNEHYVDWHEETGVKIIAVSVDNARSMARVAPFVNGRGWTDIQFYLDPNQDFKREMNIINVPHTLLLNKDNEVVWQHTSYSEGDEYELYDQLIELSEK
jgi:thiol-disulfide isomerase/thioredoxin